MGISVSKGYPMTQSFVLDRATNIKQTSKAIRHSRTLLVTKTFFERLNTRSGKDYSWIRPLTQPVSELMKYVSSVFMFLAASFPKANKCTEFSLL